MRGKRIDLSLISATSTVLANVVGLWWQFDKGVSDAEAVGPSKNPPSRGFRGRRLFLLHLDLDTFGTRWWQPSSNPSSGWMYLGFGCSLVVDDHACLVQGIPYRSVLPFRSCSR